MSTEPTRRTLGDYIIALVGALRAAEPLGFARLAQLVNGFRGRVTLDREEVVLSWGPDGLVVEPPSDAPVDGEGTTDRATVLALLDGRLEVTDALVDGRIEISGGIDEVQRMFAAIDVLLDAAGRVPDLQQLAAELRTDSGPANPLALDDKRRTALGPDELRDVEHALLAALDLLD